MIIESKQQLLARTMESIDRYILALWIRGARLVNKRIRREIADRKKNEQPKESRP